jgi:hypothetical protein
MSKLIQIESANMKYDDDYYVETVEVDFLYRGQVVRGGRGSIKLDYETFMEKADVKLLEDLVKDKIIKELEVNNVT